ncbi:MAG: ABC transporter permease subunit, partial [Candidatus Aminicenantes bacterium]|nr:ABC transporter permease subunit [Candidatus Aminicenantes bacterium]
MGKFIGIELRKEINKTILLILILFILSVLFLNFVEMGKIEKINNIKDEFVINENQKIENYYSYRQYGWAGFKMLFITSPIGAVFNSTALDNLQSANDIGVRLDINNLKKGGYVFKRGIDLYRYLMVFLCCLALGFGWFSFRNRKYIKLLLSTRSKSKFIVYCSILIARTIIVFLSICILTLCLIMQFYLMGINISGSEIVIIKIMLNTFLFMIFFLLSGAFLGFIKSASKSGITALIFVLIIFFLWPNFFYLLFSIKAENEMISVYRTETEKTKVFHEFEKMRIEYIKDKEDKIKASKELSNKFLNEGTVNRLENDLIDKTKKNIKQFHLWSIFNPVTFYESAVNEICGSGLNEYQRFWQENLDKKKEFSKYIIEKMFQRQTGKIEPFLSGDDYIFYSKPTYPHYFGFGLLVQILYIV